MDVDYTINDRLNEYLVLRKIDAAKLSEGLGWDRLDKAYNITQKKTGVSLNVAVAVCRKYKELSIEWLLLGEGEMLKQNNFYEKATHEENNITFVQSKSGLVETIEDKKIIIDFLNGDVSRLKKENELLKQEIENLKKGKHKTIE